MGLSKTQTGIVFCGDHSLDRNVDFLISFEAGHVSARYPTPFSTYQRLRDEATSQLDRQPAARDARKSTSRDSRRDARPRKLTWNEQRELAEIEARIEALETEKASLKTAINHSGEDYLKLQKLADQLRNLEQTLETMMERWLELSEIAE